MTDLFEKLQSTDDEFDGLIDEEDWSLSPALLSVNETTTDEALGVVSARPVPSDEMPEGAFDDAVPAAVSRRSATSPFFSSLLSLMGFMTGPFIRYRSSYSHGYETPLSLFVLLIGASAANKSATAKPMINMLTKMTHRANRSFDARKRNYEKGRERIKKMIEERVGGGSKTKSRRRSTHSPPPGYFPQHEGDMFDGHEPDSF